MRDPQIRITNPGTRSRKSISNINMLSGCLSLYYRWKLPSGAKAQACIQAEALNYVVINNFLFRIDTHKDKDLDKENSFLLVILEKYEPIIFYTYHDSLLAGHCTVPIPHLNMDLCGVCCLSCGCCSINALRNVERVYPEIVQGLTFYHSKV